MTISKKTQVETHHHHQQQQQQQHQVESHQQKKPKVLILKTTFVFQLYEKEFHKKFEVLKAWESQLPLEAFLEAYATDSVEAIFCSGMTPITKDIISQLPHLKIIATESTGLEHIDLSECRKKGISVTNAGTVYAEDVADMAIGLYIDVLRKISMADRFIRNGLWGTANFPLASKLGGKRVGIVGLGNIGIMIAKRLEAFGCTMSYNSRKKKASVPYKFYSDVVELASDNDVLIVCCSLTEQTRHMINKEVLTALGKDGALINVGRGAIIDQDDLVECLLEDQIAGAGLDVFENEPNVPKELISLENVVMTPHRAAFTKEAFFDAFQLVMANLEAFFSNQPLVTLVPNPSQ